MTTPTLAPAATTTMSDAQITQYIREHYGYLAGFLRVPELRSLLFQAARGGWDVDRIRGALFDTKWWKTTGETARQWDALVNLDPATANSRLTAARVAIQREATQLGVTVSPDTIARLAVNVNRLGWTDEQIREALGAQFRLDRSPRGTAAVTVGGLRDLAHEYGLDVSDSNLQTWTRQILSGLNTLDAYRVDLANKAKTFYNIQEISPTMSTRQYADQYIQLAAKTLGINEASIDLMDPKWRRALTQVDPSTGQKVPMSLDQWDTQLKTNPIYGFDRTRNGRQQAADFQAQLLQGLGWAS
jgi:hypothetical protein